MPLTFHSAAAAAFLLASSTLVAQVTLPPHANTYNGFTRGYNFVAQVPFFITALELPLDAFQAGDTASFLVRINGVDALHNIGGTAALIPTNLAVAVGDSVDILGNWSPAVAGNFTAHNSYTASYPLPGYNTLIEGVAHDLVRAGWQWDIGDPLWTSAGGTGTYLAPTTGQLGRIFIYTSSTGSGGTIATNTTLGNGCGGSLLGDGSVYELFASGFDLANTSHTYAWIGNGYIVLPGASSGFVTPAGTGIIALTDDSVAAVQLPFPLPSPQGFRDSVTLCSNGFLWFKPNTSADLSESVAELLSQDSRLCFLWDDLNPAAGGQVTGEVDPVNPNAFHITFTNVPQYANTDQNTVQVTLFATGDIEVKYGNVALGDCLVGLSSGNGATDPGQSDYSSLPTAPIGPFTTGQAVPFLTQAASTRPVLGTNWNLVTTNILPGAVFAMNIFGVSDPMIPDLGFLGLPGCELRTSPDLLVGPTLFAPGQSSYTFTFPMPATPVSLVGFEVFSQTAVFGNGLNPFNALTSNGVKGTLGDL